MDFESDCSGMLRRSAAKRKAAAADLDQDARAGDELSIDIVIPDRVVANGSEVTIFGSGLTAPLDCALDGAPAKVVEYVNGRAVRVALPSVAVSSLATATITIAKGPATLSKSVLLVPATPSAEEEAAMALAFAQPVPSAPTLSDTSSGGSRSVSVQDARLLQHLVDRVQSSAEIATPAMGPVPPAFAPPPITPLAGAMALSPDHAPTAATTAPTASVASGTTSNRKMCLCCNQAKSKVFRYLGVRSPICNACNQHWRRHVHQSNCATCRTLTALGADPLLRGEEKTRRSEASGKARARSHARSRAPALGRIASATHLAVAS